MEAIELATDENEDELWIIAWAALLLLVGGNANRPLSTAQRRRARGLLRDRFDLGVARLAQRYIAGDLSLVAWQSEVYQLIAEYTRQMAVAGAGTMPNAQTQGYVAEAVESQRPYLDGFAAALTLGAMSLAAMTARSRQYGGVGWSAWFVGQGQGAAYGYIERWQSRDDKYVCRYCAQQHGRIYLPGDGPMPGRGCYGVCRCVRVLEYNLDEYRRLTGR